MAQIATIEPVVFPTRRQIGIETWRGEEMAVEIVFFNYGEAFEGFRLGKIVILEDGFTLFSFFGWKAGGLKYVSFGVEADSDADTGQDLWDSACASWDKI